MSSESKVFLEQPNVMTLTLFFLSVFVFIGLAKIGLFAQLVVLLRILVKQLAMKTLILSLYVLLLYSCTVSKSTQIIQSSRPMPIQISVIDMALFNQEKAPIRIDSISMREHILILNYRSTVDVGSLSLVGSPLLAKSFPPIRNCKFISSEKAIEQNDIDFKEIYQGELYFELKPLAHKFVKDAPTYLQIEGWPEKILFIYPE